MRGIALVAAAGLALAAGPARAESPRYGSFELRLSGYHPNIDAEFGGRAHPFQDTFGGDRGWMGRVLVSRSLFTRFGTVDVGIGAGYWERYGHGVLQSGAPAAETTAFKVIPANVSATYRFDWLVEQFGIPFAPYGRISFEHYFWWINNGSGSTASFAGESGSGGTNGYSFTGGLAFLLDFLDPSLARQMDNDTGINHTYVFIDFTKSYISDFHSSKSFDLSDDIVTVAGGILFVF